MDDSENEQIINDLRALTQRVDELETAMPRKRQIGKLSSYVFTLLVTLFFAYEVRNYHSQGKEVPATLWMPLLVLIGTGLGVNISPESIGKAVAVLLPKS